MSDLDKYDQINLLGLITINNGLYCLIGYFTEKNTGKLYGFYKKIILIKFFWFDKIIRVLKLLKFVKGIYLCWRR